MLPFRRLTVVLAVAMPLATPTNTGAGDPPPQWPQFRGPGGTGIAPGQQGAPVEFGPEKGLLWKTPLPVGHSSPVIWGDRIFVTGYHPDTKRLFTLGLDRTTGSILWRHEAPTTAIEPVHDISNPAASTPVTDGKSVFVYFGSYGLIAYDFEGRERWKRPLPMAKTFFDQGSGTSPILAGNRLIVELTLERESYLLAVRTDSGETVWKAAQPEWNGGWATPVAWREGEEEMVGVFNPGRFTAFSLRDGSERWWVGDLPAQTCATPVAGDGVLFLSASGMQGERENVTLPPAFDAMIASYDRNRNGRLEVDEIPETLLVTDRRSGKGAGDLPLRGWIAFFTPAEDTPKGDGNPALPSHTDPPTTYDRAGWESMLKASTEFYEGRLQQSSVLAVRVGGKGDVTKSHVVWAGSRGVPEVPSPLLYRDRLYLVKSGGIVISREAATGKTVFQGRLGVPGAYYSSPVAADDRIYLASDEGTIVVLEAKDSLEVLARNELQEPILATPAIVDGKLYVRTLSHLYAFSSGRKASAR